MSEKGRAMKRVVGRWTAIQNGLEESKEANALWNLIERRTWGKRGQSLVAIKLNKEQEQMVIEAESKLAPNEQHGA